MAELKINFEKMAEGFIKTAKEKGMFVGWWIPVSERLPERDVNVLAYVIGVGIKYQRVMWIDDCTGEWVGFVGSGYKDRVIAWMPLPEPYKESEEE